MHDLAQYVLSGLSVGCVAALVALGLIVVANVTGVYNFATGEYVMVGGMITAVTIAAGWAVPLAVLASVVVVALVAVVQERTTVAPVRGKVGQLGLVIASLGVGVALRGAALLIWEEDPRSAPTWQSGDFHLLGATLSNQVKWIWLTTALSLLFVVWLFTRTDLGRAMRACAINPVAARLTGIRLGSMSMASFALSGALCGLIASVTVSQTLVRWDSGLTIGIIGFIAAALGGFTSPVRGVIAGLALGVVEAVSAGLISSDYREAIVYGTLILYLLVRDVVGEGGVIAHAIKSRRASAAGSRDAPELRAQVAARVEQLAERARPTVSAPRASAGSLRRLVPRRVRPMALLPTALLLAAALLVSGMHNLRELDTAVFIVLTAIAATGLGLVMGLAAQFSLGQAGFVLVSGYTAAILTADHGWSPLAALVVAVAASVVLGLLVGWLTLRLEGLNLALATLALLLVALVFVYQQEDLTHGTAGVQGVAGLSLLGHEIVDPRQYFYVSLGVLGLTLLIARNVWASRTGRALRAVGLDQEAAESVGIDAWRLKLRVFVLGAAMAGVAGVLWAYYLQYAAPDTWDVKLTIDLVTYVIVGGVISPFGAAVGAVVVGGLQYLVRETIGTSAGGDSSTYEILLSGVLLVFFVLVFRNGLVAIPRALADAAGRLRGRRRAAAAPEVDEPSALAEEGHRPPPRLDPLPVSDTPLLAVEGLTKRFGSLVAVDGVGFALTPGTVTAMIGPNGAGKSTVINMLAGTLLPSAGAIGVGGHATVGLRPQEIVRLGLARTFQTPRLFDGMTVLETVMLARDPHGSRFWLGGSALRTPRARRDEREARVRALAWLEFVGLAGDADALATSLPVGKQRLAEVARALATEPTVLLLDEPAAGLDGGETRALARLVRSLGDAGMAVLLVEHDMGMVMSIADRVVVLEEGRKLADGTPAEIGSDQKVVDAYLGVVHA